MTLNYNKLANMLQLNIIKVTQDAAIAAAKLRGHGNEKLADKAAVDAMRSALNQLDIDGTIVIGEGERDEAPMLYIGEKVGTGQGPAIDIALDPLEGTTLCAKNQANSLAVIAIANKNCLLYAPDIYMQKLAIGPGYVTDLVEINAPIAENIAKLAKAKNVSPAQIKVCIMDRDRHEDLIEDVRKTGASISLISDGDVGAIIEVAKGKLDLYVGIGGAPEGVLAAAALRCLGGQIQGKLIFDNDTNIARARDMGIMDIDRIYRAEDMAKGEVIFAASGVTDGELLKGVYMNNNKIITESLLMHSSSKTLSFIKNEINIGKTE